MSEIQNDKLAIVISAFQQMREAIDVATQNDDQSYNALIAVQGDVEKAILGRIQALTETAETAVQKQEEAEKKLAEKIEEMENWEGSDDEDVQRLVEEVGEYHSDAAMEYAWTMTAEQLAEALADMLVQAEGEDADMMPILRSAYRLTSFLTGEAFEEGIGEEEAALLKQLSEVLTRKDEMQAAAYREEMKGIMERMAEVQKAYGELYEADDEEDFDED